MAKREQYGDTVDVIVASSGTYSASFQIPRWATFVGVYVPDIDAGAVGLEVSKDDSTFIPVGDLLDGDDGVLVASGSDPIYVDFSTLVGSIPLNWYLRFTCASQTSGATTWTVSFRA